MLPCGNIATPKFILYILSLFQQTHENTRMRHFFLLTITNSLAFLLLPLSLFSQNTDAPTFSHERGFYENNFQLQLSAESGATIYYTTDGRRPSNSSGSQYAGSISINTSKVIRAAAYKNGQLSEVATHTFIFLDDVIRQPKNLPGWPNPVYPTDFRGNSATLDYEMDPSIVNDPAYSDDLMKGMKDIPTMCMSMKQSDFWTINSAWGEKAMSIEVLYPNKPSDNHQADGGVEGMSHKHQKRSYRLEFKSEYGPTNFRSDIMKRTSPLNRESVAGKFDQLVLRAGTQRSWARNWVPDGAVFMRDQWYRDSQIEMSGASAHGTYVHLYVNAVYWGLYNLAERPNKGFMEEYMGGQDEEWFVFNHNGNLSGDPSRWNYILNTLVHKDLSNANNYNEFTAYVNAQQFIDYLIVSWMTGMVDWPGNNYYGSNRFSPEPESMLFWAWDCEQSWDTEFGAHEGAWVHKDFRKNKSGGHEIASIFNAAKHNKEFMMLFADRVYAHCFNDGPLTDDNQRTRWAVLADYIRDAVVAESARWGDGLEDGVTRTRNGHWQTEVNRVDGVMNGNVAEFMNSLDEEDYYPNIDPPTWNRHGGLVDNGFELTMSNPNGTGTIYYRTDGQDPRNPGGGTASQAQTYHSPISIDFPTTVTARVKNGNTWSALRQASFEPITPIQNIFINEWLASNNSDTTDASGKYEDWVELYNANDIAVNVGGLYISDNLNNPTRWQIPSTNPEATRIEPKGYLLLWADSDTAEGPTHLDFKISAGGEIIGLYQMRAGTPNPIDIVSFGEQITDISQGRFPDGSATIRSFVNPTPARANLAISSPTSPLIEGLYINEFLADNENDIVDTAGNHEDWIEIYNDDTIAVDIGGLYMTDDLSVPLNWKIPDTLPGETTIQPGGYLRLWADDDTEEGVLHLGFKLGAGGEAIGIVQLEDTLIHYIDSTTYSAQITDVSFGRFPDGSPNWEFMATTTPMAANVQDSIDFDCTGVPNGTAVWDSCGECLELNDPYFNACLSTDTLLFVVRSVPAGPADALVADELIRMGYQVKLVAGNLAKASDANHTAGVIISSTVISSSVGGKFANVIQPVMTWEPFIYDDMGMTGTQTGKDYQFVYSQLQLNVEASNHPLAAGLSGITAVTRKISAFAWGKPGTSAISIATVVGNVGQSVIFGYEANSTLANGTPAPARRLGFFMHDNTALSWTEDGKALFQAAVCWFTGCSNEVNKKGIFDHAQFKMYPNPASEDVQIEWLSNRSESITFELVDLMGKVYQRYTWQSQNGVLRKKVPVSHLAGGVYIMKLKQGEEYQYRKIVIKKH